MDHFFLIVFYFLILLAIHMRYGWKQKIEGIVVPLSSGLLIFWVLLGGVVFKFSMWPKTSLFVLLAIGALLFYQDWTTQYFSNKWYVFLLIVPYLYSRCVVEDSSRLMASLLTCMSGIAVYFHYLGIADFFYLLIIGGVIGFWRLILLLWTSSIIGLIDAIFWHKTYIPLISALVINTIWILTFTF